LLFPALQLQKVSREIFPWPLNHLRHPRNPLSSQLPIILYGIVARLVSTTFPGRNSARSPDGLPAFPVTASGRDSGPALPVPGLPSGKLEAPSGNRSGKFPCPLWSWEELWGYVAVSEAAVLTVLYVLIHRGGRVPGHQTPGPRSHHHQGQRPGGGILIILGVSFGLTNTLINDEIPARILVSCRTMSRVRSTSCFG